MPGRQDQIAEPSARLAVLSGALARLPAVTLMRDVRYSKLKCRGRYSSASERDGGSEMLGKVYQPFVFRIVALSQTGQTLSSRK